MNACMHEKDETQGGGSDSDRIVPSVATQSKSYGSLSNSPFMTSFLCALLLSPK